MFSRYIKKDRTGHIPGWISSQTEGYLKIMEKENTKSKASDTLNREYVKTTILKYIKSGLSENEAIEKIMNDPIINEFEYLTKNGINIKQCFKNWIKHDLKMLKAKNNLLEKNDEGVER